MSADTRLPIKVLRIPGGAMLRFANSETLYVHGRDPAIADQAHAMTLEAAETLAKDVTRAFTAASGESDVRRVISQTTIPPLATAVFFVCCYPIRYPRGYRRHFKLN
jgi:hypothetical protein